MANPLNSKNIVLGVTGSIAAYKAADIASRFTQSGAYVKVILTESAIKFISPLTFQSVTGNKSYTDNDLWVGDTHVTHIGLGHTADLVVIAPVSANTLAKLANGFGDNLLALTVLASHCPIILAPAMDGEMWSNPATQKNFDILKQRGFHFIGPESGHLASGMIGLGRMAEPQTIYAYSRYILSRNGNFSGKKVVITAAGTREDIDPVRFISNKSSGKQGFALAQASIDSGADVILITGKTNLETPAGVKRIDVTSASEMYSEVMSESNDADILLMAAAVADFRPILTSAQKIKKDSDYSYIPLEPTEDILLAVGERKTNTGFPRILVGFAAESQDLLVNSKKKLKSKNLDLIIANDVTSANAGFDVDTNQVILISPDGTTHELTLMDKYEVAEAIIEKVLQLCKK